MGAFLSDLRFAARVLLKKPSLTAIVVITLALGIGAGSAMFGLVHTLLMRPLDLPDVDRLVLVQEMNSRREFNASVAPRTFLDLQEQTRAYEKLIGLQDWDVTLAAPGGDPEQVLAYQSSPGFLDLVGVPPLLGRWFAADEIDGGNPSVTILSHRLWQRRFGGDPAIVGRPVQLDGASYTVVGVMPEDFRLPHAAELWSPLTLDPDQRADRTARYITVLGKLAPGATLVQADAELRTVHDRLATAFPLAHAGRELRVVTLAHGITEDYTRSFIFMLFGAALFVLLIACANVANVFLAHAVARRRELAVRTALGAGRGRIVRQLLTEAALLGLLGGAAALFVAEWSLALIKAGLPPTITRYIAGWDRMGVDGITLGFAIASGVLVGLLFGVVPALQVSRTDPGGVLKDGERGSGGPRAQRLRAVLVVAQVALAMVLLIGAGAMVQGFRRYAAPRTPIDGDAILTLRVALPFTIYEKDHQLVDFERRALAGLRALPGVEAAAVSHIPWGPSGWSRLPEIEGRVERPEQRLSVDYRPASPGYLELLRVPLLEGRTLRAADDDPAAPRVAVVTRTLARRYWPEGQALGKRLRFGEPDAWLTVVGVVEDVEEAVGERTRRPAVFLPIRQAPVRNLYFALRGGGDPHVLGRPAAAVVHTVDPSLPVTEVRTLREARDLRFAGLELGASMMAAFALLALLLAVVGIYGVAANLVSQRTHEIGVRMALGAQRDDVLRLVLGRGLVLTVSGVVLGLVLGIALVRMIDSVLVGLVAGGAAGFAAVAAAVTACAMLGSFVPARRATRVDPMIALRAE